MFSATMAVPLPPAGQDDFVEEVIAKDGEDEPNFKEVIDVVRRMRNKPPGSEVVIELDASSVLAAQGGTFHPVRGPLPSHRKSVSPAASPRARARETVRRRRCNAMGPSNEMLEHARRETLRKTC